MANYTEHYQLHLWEASDDFLRTDFNADFAKIDAAVKGVETAAMTEAGKKCELTIGQFTGNGEQYYNMNLGFKPRFLMIWATSYAGTCSEIMGNPHLELTDTGFRMEYSERDYANHNGRIYDYHAFH